jgi:hypothetical protein
MAEFNFIVEGRRKKEEGRRKKEEVVIARVSAIKNVLAIWRGYNSWVWARGRRNQGLRGRFFNRRGRRGRGEVLGARWL